MLRGSTPTIQSKAEHDFAQAPMSGIPRSKFNRSHGVKTTFDEGYLIPVLVDEMLPGDTFHLRSTLFARMATPIYPIMDNLYLEEFYFAVPVRLVWENWEAFNGANIPDYNSSTDYTVPTVPSLDTGFATGSLADYFGLPTLVAEVIDVNALHFRAYNLIWNEWFRDQNLQDEVTVAVDDGPDTLSHTVLLQRGKRHDYFTSCLPFPQKGPDVEIPLGTIAPIKSNGTADAYGRTEIYVNEYAAAATQSLFQQSSVGSNIQFDPSIGTGSLAAWPLTTDTNYNYADLTDASAATINALRLAWQTQKLYERDARGGTRYTEVIKSHFGVISPDMRLQRPEYIGGGSTPVSVNPIAQTSGSPATPTDSNVLGGLAAYGLVTTSGHGFTYSATEHMLIIGLVSVRADLNYQYGIDRMWSRQTRLDYYWPALSHIGEQAVLNQEIYAQGTAADTEVFGYQERYAEYRYKPSNITGLMRSNASGTLHAWHLAQDFMSLPALNATFIVEDAPMARIEAVASQPDFILDGYFQYHCARPMPVYAIPGLVDHF